LRLRDFFCIFARYFKRRQNDEEMDIVFCYGNAHVVGCSGAFFFHSPGAEWV
jgi:hypothetical protein